MMQRFKVNDRVSVFWKESKTRYSGTISEVHENGTYDIVYDESVQGKQCIEINAADYRIESDENYFFDNEGLVSEESSRDSRPVVSVNDSVQDLLKSEIVVPESEDTSLPLKNMDTIEIFKGLSGDKILELFEKAPDKLNSLSMMLIEHVNSNDEAVKHALIDSNDLENLETLARCINWARAQSSEEDSQLMVVMGVISSCASLLKVLTFTNFLQIGNKTKSRDSVVSEEFVERSVQLVTHVLSVNLLMTNPKSSIKEDGYGVGAVTSASTPTRAKGGKGKSGVDVMHNKALAELCKHLLPIISSYVQSLECLLTHSKQSDRLCMSVIDLAFTILKLDPSAGAAVEVIASVTSNTLLALHRASISLLRVLFKQYSSHRTSILIECLSLLAQVYTPKNPHKMYALHYSSYTIGDHGRFATTACIALLTCLQSTVNIETALSGIESSASSTSVQDIGKGEFSNKSLSECRRCCNVFVMELFKRCSHKEASGEYRNVATILLNELFAATLLPSWPICSILIEQMSKRLVALLNAISTSSDTKRDVPYISFLLDLMGALCLHLHSVDKIVDTELSAARGRILSPFVRESIQKKINTLKSEWLSHVVSVTAVTSPSASYWTSAPETPDSSTTAQTTKTPSGGKRGKKSSIAVDSLASSVVPAPVVQMMLPTSKALAILSEISSLTLDAVAEQPLQIVVPDNSSEGNSNADGSGSNTLLALIPPAHAILAQIDGQEDLISKLPELSAADLNYIHVSNHLQQLYDSSGSKTSSSISSSGKLLDHSSSEDFVRDAHDMTLSLWHQDADFRVRGHVCSHLEKLMSEDVNHRRSSVNGDAGKDVVSIIESKKKSFFSSRDEYSWRGNYSLESILGNVRYVLVDRLYKELFEAVFHGLLSALEDSSPIVRSRALKHLAALLSSDADLIARDTIRQSVTLRFKDRAISVREEAVKLVGTYIIRGWDDVEGKSNNLNLTSDYLEGLKLRLTADEGISVRKSVVTIFREILLHQPGHPQYTELCLLMLRQAANPKEEDTIKDVIRSTFQTIWFLPPSVTAIQTNAKLSAVGNTSSAASAASLTEMEPTTSDFVANTPTRSGPSTPASRAVTPSSQHRSKKQKDDEALSLHIDSTARQLVDIISIEASDGSLDSTSGISSGVHSWIITLLREVLHAKSQGDEVTAQLRQRRAASHSHVEKIVKSLVELLLKAEENDAAVLAHVQQKNLPLTQFIVNTIVTISLLCEAHPPLISKHLDTLLPYLQGDPKCDARQNADICLKVTQILASTAMLEKSSLKIKDKSGVLTNLTNIALRFKSDNVNHAIRCMALLIANITEDATPLYQLANRCFQTLIQFVRVFPNPEKVPNEMALKIQRSILVLGFVCEHLKKCQVAFLNFSANFVSDLRAEGAELTQAALELNTLYNSANADELVVKHCTLRDIVALNPNAIYGAVYVALIYSVSIPSVALQVTSVQALCGVFTGHPRLMLACQETGLLSQLLGNTKLHTFDENVYQKFIESLRHMMTVEEMRLEQQAAINLMKDSGMGIIPTKSIGDTVLGPVESESDSSIGGFVLQQQLPMITGFLYRPSESLRYAAMQLIGTLLRQGMLCPLDVIAQLIAFLGDSSQRIRAESLSVLLLEDDKHPSFLDNRLLEGVESTLTFQLKTMGHFSAQIAMESASDDKVIAASSAANRSIVSIYSSLYLSAIQQNKKRRSEFLYGLLRRSNTIFTSIREAFAEYPQSFEAYTIALAASTAAAAAAAAMAAAEQQRQLELAMADGGKADIASGIPATEGTGSSKSSPLKRPAGSLKGGLVRSSSMSSRASVGSAGDANTPTFLRTASVNSLNTSTSNGGGKSNDFLTSAVPDALHKLKVVDFMCTTLAYLPYDSMSEPLFVIYWINRNILLTTSIILSKVKQALLSLGSEVRGSAALMQPPVLGTKPSPAKRGAPQLSDSDLIFNEQAFVQWLGTNKISTTTDEADEDVNQSATLETSDPVTKGFRLIELISMAVELRSKEAPLRLKSFLKSWYNIPDEKCIAYNPEDKTTTATSASSTSNADKVNIVDVTMVYYPEQLGVPNLEEELETSDLIGKIIAAIRSGGGSNSSAHRSAALSALKDPLIHLLKTVVMDYNRIEALLHHDPDDFTLVAGGAATASGGNKRRKKAASEGGGSSGAKAKGGAKRGTTKAATATAGAGKAKGRTKKRRSYVDSGSESEEQEQDVYDSNDDEYY